MANEQGFPIWNQRFTDDRGFITQSWRQFLVSLWNRTGGSLSTASFVPGDLKAWPGPVIPDGWLYCDGTAVSRTTYSSLFDAIGETWGPGDGFSTFNIPDLRARVLLGADDITYLLGSTGGLAEILLTVDQLPPHTHVVTDLGHTHTITDPEHAHTSADASGSAAVGAGSASASASVTGSSPTGISIDVATTGITLEDTGLNDPIPSLPPYGAVYFLIKT